MKSNDGSLVDVPCSRCGFCLQNKRKEWSFRLQKEARYHESAFFATLTYSDENLIWANDCSGRSYPVLHKPDFQLFMKRLRFKQSKITDKKIKYYAVGEYGSNTNRPHYHALLFSMEPKLVNQLNEIWGEGFSHVGSVNNDSIDYITKYVVNKHDQKHYLVPPFACISNGIGLQHFKDNISLYKRDDIVTNQRGYKQKLPRYYRDKLSKPKSSASIVKLKQVAEYEMRRADEVQKLSKTHKDAEAYMFERDVHNNNRILKSVKEGGIF